MSQEITHVRALKDDLSRCRALVLPPEPRIQNDADGADNEAGCDTSPKAGPVFGSTEMNVSVRVNEAFRSITYS